MQSFQWGDNYLTGIVDVDDQHHNLVDILNEFGKLLTQNELKRADIERLLTELAAYAHYHFEEEENLMLESGIDVRHFQFHKKDHDNFMQQVSAMSAELCSAPASAFKHLLDFLTNWLAYHILGVDQNMAHQLAAIKAGASAKEAYFSEEKNHLQSTEPLLAALRNLFQQLSERNQALLEMNKTLEIKVQERTRALTDANFQLQKIAMTDALTELPNRHYAMGVLQQLWSEYESDVTSLVCMMIDADQFKQINDNYGHDSGDFVLQALARELKHSVRNDDIVCRLGGDDFLIICMDTPLEGAMYLAKLVRKAVAEIKVRAGMGVWKGSVSIGVAARDETMDGPDALLKAADDGVCLAKRDGRNCVRSIQIASSG